MDNHEPRYDIDFNRPELILDPFPAYEEIRSRGRAVWNEYLKGWMLTGYDDVVAAHADPVHLSSTVHKSSFLDAPTMITTDPPEHTRLQGVAKQAFTKWTVTGMRQAVASVVDELVASETVAESLRTGTPFDFAAEVSGHIPTLVIADILGVSRADRATFRQWSIDLALSVDYGLSAGAAARRRKGIETATMVNSYFREEIADRRANPRDDLMTDLVAANEKEQLSTAELSAICLLLLLAGNDTTNKMISGMFMLLGQNPHERHRVLVSRPVEGSCN